MRKASSQQIPGESEICNGVDDDCDTVADDGLTLDTFYADSDGDTYGDAAVATSACSAPAGYVSDDTDCDDSDIDVNPGEAEVCNGIDDDCAGGADDGLAFTTYFRDADSDTYGTTAMTESTEKSPMFLLSSSVMS